MKSITEITSDNQEILDLIMDNAIEIMIHPDANAFAPLKHESHGFMKRLLKENGVVVGIIRIIPTTIIRIKCFDNLYYVVVDENNPKLAFLNECA